MRFRFHWAALFLVLVSSLACSSQGGTIDEYIPQGLVVLPDDRNSFVTVNHTKQWAAVVGNTRLPSDQVLWSSSRGTVSVTGVLTAPDTPSGSQDDWVEVRRINPDAEPKSAPSARASFKTIVMPSIQDFTSNPPSPVPSGSYFDLFFHFSDGRSWAVYDGNRNVDTGMTSPGHVFLIKITATTTFTLKVMNQAGDSVSKDLTVSVQ